MASADHYVEEPHGFDLPLGAVPGAPRRDRRRRAHASACALATPLAEGRTRERALVREGIHRRALILADVVAVGLALVIMLTLSAHGVGSRSLVALPAIALVVVVVHKAAGLYDRDQLVLSKTTLEEAPAILQISGIYALLTWFGEGQLVGGHLSRSAVLLLWTCLVGLVLSGRVAARAIARRLVVPERCLVVGDAASVATVTAKLRSSGARAEVIATVIFAAGDAPVDLEEFARLVEQHEVDRVIVAPLTSDCAELLDVIRVAKAIGVSVSLIPRLLEVVGSAVTFDQLDGLTVLGLRRAGLSRSSRLLKRGFDLVGSTALIVLAAPLMLAISVAIVADTRGPVFFRQVRIGRGGHPFRIIKFRSMVCDAETLKPAVAHLNEVQGGMFKIAGDPRITRVGRMLRRTCLDELPQLFNVWRGDMSLVGPRPLVVDEDVKITGLNRSRLQLTPGMTGHWQVLGAGRIPMQEMIAIDYLYVANWSLWTDVKLLLRTVPLVLTRAGM